MSTPYWLLGLPFDVTTLEEVRARIFAAADGGEQIVFATPNVNFVAQAARDPQFRSDVLRTDLSLVDGMPLVWLGRMLEIPFAQRIAGSDLLESLIARPGARPLRVFYFGGDEGAAEAALRATNRRGGGMVAVGAHYPGFASIAQMSSPPVIDVINGSGADLLVVALGAAKGHRWIEANRQRLRVPVISHLGAAINFVAGRLQRAPRFTHGIGLEWLWRIKEEPALSRRYVRDGAFLLERIVRFAIPQYLRQRLGGSGMTPIAARSVDGGALLTIEGGLTGRNIDGLPPGAAVIELHDLSQADAAGIGWLYAQRYRFDGRTQLASVYCDEPSRAVLRHWQAECLVDGEC
jgi:N-acetylglucosaminyldiphosphoundecaprenol N-acetyl-beta-D-mannosaminyltransferase